jgi:hypothetical protein
LHELNSTAEQAELVPVDVALHQQFMPVVAR